MPGKRGEPIERFMRFVSVDTATGCWIWTGTTVNGYGCFQLRRGRKVEAHRFAYEWFVGPIPDGLTLDHVCHFWDVDCDGGDGCVHRRCVNPDPDHLEPVDGRTNTLRGRSIPARNHDKTFCAHGHPFFGANVYIDANGHRHCRTCRRRTDRAAYMRRRAQHLQGKPLRTYRRRAA